MSFVSRVLRNPCFHFREAIQTPWCCYYVVRARHWYRGIAVEKGEETWKLKPEPAVSRCPGNQASVKCHPLPRQRYCVLLSERDWQRLALYPLLVPDWKGKTSQRHVYLKANMVARGRCRPPSLSLRDWLGCWTLPELQEFRAEKFKWRVGRDCSLLPPLTCSVWGQSVHQRASPGNRVGQQQPWASYMGSSSNGDSGWQPGPRVRGAWGQMVMVKKWSSLEDNSAAACNSIFKWEKFQVQPWTSLAKSSRGDFLWVC